MIRNKNGHHLKVINNDVDYPHCEEVEYTDSQYIVEEFQIFFKKNRHLHFIRFVYRLECESKRFALIRLGKTILHTPTFSLFAPRQRDQQRYRIIKSRSLSLDFLGRQSALSLVSHINGTLCVRRSL